MNQLIKSKKKTIAFYGDLSFRDSILAILGNDIYEVDFKDKSIVPDIVYCIYGAGPSLLNNISFWLNQSSKIIIHWIGTDVLDWQEKLISSYFKSRIYFQIWKRVLLRGSSKKRIINLAGAPWLKEELKEIGIESAFFPITTIGMRTIDIGHGISKENDFITYLPKGRFNFYGGSIINKLAVALPKYNFLIIHPDIDEITHTDIKIFPSNVTLLPKQSFDEMQEHLRRSKCLLRFTKHDGLSLSVLEALYNELTVLWTYPFPHTLNISLNDFDKILSTAKDCMKNWTPNKNGSEYVNKNYSINNWKKIFSQDFKHILDEL